MKEYGHLLRDDPLYAERAKAFAAKVRDVAEIVEELGPVAPRHPLPTTVAYHDACHLAHGQGIRAQPRKLLRDIPGLQVRDIRESEICCGSAGVYNIVEPAPARELGDRKAANISTVCAVGSASPRRSSAAEICSRQPGFAVTSIRAPVSSTLAALRSPSSRAGAGSTML